MKSVSKDFSDINTFYIQIAIFNGVLFGMSIVTFIFFLVFNATKRASLISRFVHMPLPGCPAINGALQWAQWLPGMTLFSHSPARNHSNFESYHSHRFRNHLVWICHIQGSQSIVRTQASQEKGVTRRCHDP